MPRTQPLFTLPDSSDAPPDLACQQIPASLHVFQQFADRLQGKLDDPVAVRLADARAKCKAGNPFPLVAMQWPAFVLTDEGEIEIFQRHADLPILARLTDSIREAIQHPNNPPLRMDFWQKIILAGFFDESIGEVAVKGCTGAGKGASVSMAINLWYDVFEESRTTLTSESWAHAVKNILGEVILWRTKMSHPLPGNITTEAIHQSKRHYIEVRNPKPGGGGEAFSGQHGANTLYCMDEATAVEDKLFDNAEKNARKIVMLANPRTIAGRFRSAFEPLGDFAAQNQIGICYGNIGRRLCVTVGGADCINVRESRLRRPVAPRGGIEIEGKRYEEGARIATDDFEKVRALIPNQIDTQQFRDILAKPDKRHVQVFAHGQFPDEDPELQVILSSWLPRHEAAWHDLIPVDCFGLDVARSLDGDKTVFTAGGSEGCRAIHCWQYNDTTFHRDEVLRIAQAEYGIDLRLCRNPVAIDMDGLGAGLGDMLRELGVWVIEFRGNATSMVDPRTYSNLRTEGYAVLGRRLNPDDQFRQRTWAIPPGNTELKIALCAPEKKYSNDHLRFIVEPKADIKKKLQGRSPDEADGVVYLFHAVREFHALNQYFSYLRQPLAVWPAPATTEKPGSGGAGETSATGSGVSPISPSPPKSATDELIDWINDRYGGAKRLKELGQQDQGEVVWSVRPNVNDFGVEL